MQKQEFATARILYYSLFSKLFVFSTSDERFSGVSKILSLISTAPLNDDCSRAIMQISAAFNEQDPSNLIDEYDAIFHSPPKPVRNSMSYYEEGYEMGYACVRVRKLLAKTDIRRDEKNFKENEDNVGFVFTLMSEFINRATNGEGKFDELSTELFETVINPNIDDFINAVFLHKDSEIYKDVAVLLQGFIEFERVVLELPKPVKTGETKKTYDGISRSEKIRREKNAIRKNKSKEEADAKR